MSVLCNKPPTMPILYSTLSPEDVWNQRTTTTTLDCSAWIVRDFFAPSQIAAPSPETDEGGPIENDTKTKPLTELNGGRKTSPAKHVPHRNKPPQVVARRNARERRRVQAVNNAFVQLRKAVPIQNVRGKRVSKVKTLQHAIEYIRTLEDILDDNSTTTSLELPKLLMQIKKDEYFDDYDDFDEDF